MAQRVQQISFTRGEITPLIGGARTDIEQYAIGLKTLKNGFVHQEGCVSNRAGLEYVGEVKDSTKDVRLIPFTFNSSQTYVIEFGEFYCRFIQKGGYIIYPATYGVTYSGTFEYIESVQNKNDKTVYKYKLGNDDIVYSSKSLENIAVKDKLYYDAELTEIYKAGVSASLSNGVITSIDTTEMTIEIDYDADKVAKRGQIVEIKTPYKAKDLQSLYKSQSGDVLTLTHKNYRPIDLVRYSHYDWILEEITFTSTIDAPSNVKVAWSASTPTSNYRDYKYVVTAYNEDTQEESIRSQEVTCRGHREANWLAEEYAKITWNKVEGATEYNIYRSVNGVFGYIGSSETTSFEDNCIEPDLKSSAPVHKNPFKNDNNPTCVANFQQRRLYANLVKAPQTILASNTANYKNFNICRPLNATDAITLPMADIQGNEIRHLIPMKDLIVLCQNSEWKVNGSDGVFQATPPPVTLIQSTYGSSEVQPIVSGSMVIFVQSGGSVVRDLGFDYLSDTYDGDELSLFSSHLFYGKQVKYMDYAKEPYRLIWLIMNDGSLLGLTYNKKQKLCGWHRHETKGVFESLAIVREEQEDIAYFVIKRKINGVEKKYVERFRTRLINNAKEAFLVDSGKQYYFTDATKNISGLEHLEGENVVVNADGGISYYTVQNGSITLTAPAHSVIVGLPYEFELETLNIEGDNTQGLKKTVNSVQAKIHESREDFFFVSNNGAEFQQPRSIESINDAGKLISTCVEATLMNAPTLDATIHIKQKHPLPLTILAIIANVNLGV